MEIENRKINAVFVERKLPKDIVDIKAYKNILVIDYMKEKTNVKQEKIVQSLKIVQLPEDILNKSMKKISDSEKIKIEFSIRLLNHETILYFNYFDTYFMEKDQEYFKRLFIKLCKKYNKTIVLYNVKFSFAVLTSDYFILEENGKIKKYSKKDIYNCKSKIVLKSKLIDLVKYINKDEKRIDYCLELKELIKAIYREV